MDHLLSGDLMALEDFFNAFSCSTTKVLGILDRLLGRSPLDFEYKIATVFIQ